MLLKFTKVTGAGSGSGSSSSSSSSTTFVARGTGMRMTMSTSSTMTPRIHRKGFRTPSKRHPGKALPGKLHSISRIGPGKVPSGKRFPQRPHPPPCDNSNDSGFGFDQHLEVQQGSSAGSSSSSSSSNNSSSTSSSSSSSSSSGILNSNSNNSSNLGNNNINCSNITSNNTVNNSPVQPSPQQHLIRAIPSSRSTIAAKKSSYKRQIDDEQEYIDFCTDDSEDFYTHHTHMGYAGQSPTSSVYSTNSSSGYSAGSTAELSTSNYQEQQNNRLKRKKLESIVELDNDDACSEDAFIRKIANASSNGAEILPFTPNEQRAAAAAAIMKPTAPVIPPPPPVIPPPPPAPTKFISNNTRTLPRVASKRQPAAALNSVATSSNGRVQLEIVSQPEQQHRARYQTEGSRGAVKDRSGNGFPIVRLIGYNKPTLLQVFIGTDIGRVAPHMFYQACKVAGKNSTQCNEKKVDGTMVIEIDFKPETDMTITCDCVGILKERNVDVEHRFPDHLAQKNKKKSTRCRMVFRTQLTHDDGTVETLQVCSNPIICTQPPGVPEICKKSLNSCPVDGGLELFIIGKNFLKDTHVIFQETYESIDMDNPNSEIAMRQQLGGALWEQTVMPDKEYLQQTHLICTVPPYIQQNILKPVTVQVAIISSGKKSESHSFVYTPKGSYTTLAAATTLSNTLHGSLSAAQDSTQYMDTSTSLPMAGSDAVSALWNTETKHEIDSGMMPPPITTQMPMGVRRPSLPPTNSTPMIIDQQLAHLNAVAAEALKTELLDESSQSSIAEAMHSPEAGPNSPNNTMQYRTTRYVRKPSIESMIYESNSLNGFPVTPAAAAVATAQLEVARVAAAIAKEIINAEVVQQQQQQQQQVTVPATHNTVDKFIDDLTKSSVLTANSPVTQQTLFGVDPTTVASTAAAALFPAEQQNSVAIDHTLSDILQQAAVANNQSVPVGVLERSLSMSSTSSPHSSNSTGTSPLSVNSSSSPSSNSLNGHSSPLAQEILLNADHTNSLGAIPIQQLLQSSSPNATDIGAAPAANALTTDLIMNPAVSPSTILCSANGAATAVVPNCMAPHQVTMANSILNDIAMQSQPTQQDATVAALALSNIINGPPTATTTGGSGNAVQQQLPVVQPEVTSATTTAVSNMIIKAAAAFISDQEQNNHQQQQQQQLMPNDPMLISMNNPVANSAAVAAAAAATDPLVNLLLNHATTDAPVAAVATNGAVVAAAAVNDVQSQFPMGMSTASPPESLIVALATDNHHLQKSVGSAAVTTNGAIVSQQNAAATAGILPGSVVSPTVPLPPPIPQELTTMSDQDLISYINPSTFDQI